MSVTIAEIDGCKCVCGDEIPTIHVDLLNCDGDNVGVVLKQYGDSNDGDWVIVPEPMLKPLVEALTKQLGKEFGRSM